LSAGTFDDYDITGNVTAAAAVETASITVGTDAQMTLADVVMTGSALLSGSVTVNDGGFLSNSNANTSIAAAESVDIVATSIADFDVTLGAGSVAALDLQGIALTDADMTVGASGNLVLGTSLGVAGSASNIKVSGRGDLDDTDDNAIGNEFNILGTTVTFDMSGLTTDSDNTTITTAATVKATLKTGLGDDTITGSALGDVISSGAGADTVTGGAGADSLTLGTGSDLVSYADVTLATSHSLANLSGVAVNLSTTAITAATVATAMGGTIVLGGGAAAAGADLAAGSAGYLVDAAANSTATMVRDTISGAESVTGSALGDYIVAGASAATITGGAGVDNITGGAASDVIVLGDSTDGSNYDLINGYTTTADDIQALQSVHGWNTTDNTTTLILQTGANIKAADAAADSNVMTLSGNVATHTYTSFMAGTSNYAQLETNAVAAMGATGALDNAAVFLVAIDDGAHTGLWQFTSGDGIDNATATSEVELIGILVGVTDATALVAGDFLFT